MPSETLTCLSAHLNVNKPMQLHTVEYNHSNWFFTSVISTPCKREEKKNKQGEINHPDLLLCPLQRSGWD